MCNQNQFNHLAKTRIRYKFCNGYQIGFYEFDTNIKETPEELVCEPLPDTLPTAKKMYAKQAQARRNKKKLIASSPAMSKFAAIFAPKPTQK